MRMYCTMYDREKFFKFLLQLNTELEKYEVNF